MANPSIFQLLVLGSTEQEFPLSIDGQKIKTFFFTICSNLNKQLSVLKRFRHLIGDHIKPIRVI